MIIINNRVIYSEVGHEYLIVVLPDIGGNLAYRHGLHFCCQEVYPYRNHH